MGGPGVSMWLKDFIDIEQWNNFETMLQKICCNFHISRKVLSKNKNSGIELWIANTIPIGGNYVGEGLPFSIGIRVKNFYEDLKILEMSLGFLPKQEFWICAHCNREEDHMALGYLSLYLAKNFEGIIDLGHVPKSLEHKIAVGKCYRVPRETDCELYEAFAVDSEFLEKMMDEGGCMFPK